MKKIKHYKSDIRVITLIYVFLASLIPVVLFSVTPGCTEDIIEKDAFIGQEVPKEKVQEIIYTQLIRSSIAESKIGSGVHYESSQKIETNDPYVYQDDVRQVTNVDTEVNEDGTLTKTYYLKHTKYNYQNEEQKPPLVTEPPPVVVEDAPDEKLVTNGVNQYLHANESNLRAHFASKFSAYSLETLAEAKTTYHDLSVTNIKKPVPQKAAAQLNCKEEPGQCTLNVVEVKYKLVIWEEGQPIDSYEFTTEFTNQVPFLYSYFDNNLILPALSHCVKYKAKTKDRDYLVNDCKILRNFVK